MKKNIIAFLISFLLLQNAVFANAIKFIQVTDTHYKSEEPYRGEVLEATVNSINKEKDISFVIFTGDNIDVANPKYLYGFMDIVKHLNIPYYVVIGNHDVFKSGGLSKELYMEILGKYNWFYKFKKPNYVFKKNGFVFIVFDNVKEVIPGPLGYLKESSLVWLDKQLHKYRNKNVVIFQHIPLTAEKEVASHMIFQREKYYEILDKYDNVITIISGHLHSNGEIMRNGVYHISTPTLLKDYHPYKIITISTTKNFSPMVYTELKEVEMPQK